MAAGKIQAFFGDDWEDTLDSLLSAPGAMGNIAVATSRQVRAVDIVAFSFVVLGWSWLVFGFVAAGQQQPVLVVIAVLPTLLWLFAGLAGGLVFEVAGLGVRALRFWEAYLLIAFFAMFGTIALRLALNPRDRWVYRATPSPADLGPKSLLN